MRNWWILFIFQITWVNQGFLEEIDIEPTDILDKSNIPEVIENHPKWWCSNTKHPKGSPGIPLDILGLCAARHWFSHVFTLWRDTVVTVVFRKISCFGCPEIGFLLFLRTEFHDIQPGDPLHYQRNHAKWGGRGGTLGGPFLDPHRDLLCLEARGGCFRWCCWCWWLVGGFKHFFHFSIIINIWDVILPIDELIFFKMVIAPPTRWCWARLSPTSIPKVCGSDWGHWFDGYDLGNRSGAQGLFFFFCVFPGGWSCTV